MKHKKENILYDILTSGFGTVGYINVRKLILLNAYLLIGICAFALLGFYSLLVAKNYTIAIVDLIASFAFLGCFFSLRRYRNEKTIQSIASTLLMFFLFLFILINGNKNFGLIWSFFVPMFLITINGYKKGTLLSIMFYAAVILALFLSYNSWEEKDLNALVIVRYVVAYAMSSFVIFMGDYAISKLQKELEELSSTDTLTKLYNRGKMEEYIKKAFKRKRKLKSDLVVVMADIDDFKLINDTYGHHIGDEVLKSISNILSENTRTIDMVGRWGGEEFLMIFPDISLSNAMAMVARLKDKINTHSFSVNEEITCSFGVCNVVLDDFADEDAIIAADSALYRAKNEGKNKICTITL